MIHITTRPYTKRGVSAWEIDLTIAFPDGLPPYRVRKKSPMKTEKQSADWGQRLGVELAKKGRPQRQLADPPVEKKAMTFQEFTPVFLSRWSADANLSAGSLLAYEINITQHLAPVLDQIALDQITSDHLSTINQRTRIKDNGKPRSATHRNYIFFVLGLMLRQAVEWKHLPACALKMPKVKEPRREIEIFTDDELARLRVTAKTHSEAVYLAVLLGTEAGLRLGEMVGLRWSDIDLKVGRLVVRQQVTAAGEVTPPKGGDSRPVPMTPLLTTALKAAEHLGERVIYHKGEPVTRSQLRGWLATSERRAKLVAMKSPHKLRHTYASRLLAARADLPSVQALLGHKSLSTTMKYIHLQPGQIERAVRLLSGDQTETKEGEVER